MYLYFIINVEKLQEEVFHLSEKGARYYAINFFRIFFSTPLTN